MISSQFESGPLQRNDSTKLLGSLIGNLLSEDYESTFSLEQGELILEQKLLKGASAGVKHNISLLLQFSDLSHLETFGKKECDFYVKKMHQSDDKEKKSAAAENLMSAPVAAFKSLKRAHEVALDYYTNTLDTNPLLRGELHILDTSSPAKFQFQCFLLLTSSAFVANFLQKKEPALTSWEKDSVYKKVNMVRSLRVEPYKGQPPVYEYLRKLKEVTSHTITVPTRGFTSYSEGKLSLIDPNSALDYKTQERNLPVFHANDDIHILIHETFLPEKLLGEYSANPSEREILVEPSAKKTKVVNETGNLVFLKTSQVRPVNAVPKDNYFLNLALRYAYENYLKKPYPDPYADAPDCQVTFELKDANGSVTKTTVFRQNHGLAHAARQAYLVEPVLQLLANHAKNDELKSVTENIINNPNKKQIIQIAALFLTVGRIHELRAIHDPEGHKQSRENSQKAFDDFMSMYYPVEKSSQEMEVLIKACSDAILFLAPDMSDKAKTPEEKVIFHLLCAAHTLDTPRVPGLWIKDEATQTEVAKNILNKLLYNPEGVFDSAAKNVLDKELDELWNLSFKNLRETGDRTDFSDYEAYEFIQCSQNPAHVSKVLELTKPLPLIIQEEKQEAADKKIYLDALIYLLTHSVNPDEQLKIFRNEPEFSDLIFFAGEYLKEHPEINAFTDGDVIQKIIEAFDSNEFKLAREKIVSRPAQPISFGDEKIDKLPRLLKAALPLLREAKLSNPDNIRQCLKLHQDHPDVIFNFVESLNYLRKQNKLNEDTFQLMCLQASVSPEILDSFLGNYYRNKFKLNLKADASIQIAQLYLEHEDVRKTIFFTLYAYTGRLDSLKKLLEDEPDLQKRKEIIRSNHFAAFIHSVNFGHKEIVKYLLKTASADAPNMINRISYYFNSGNLLSVFGSPDVLKCFCDVATHRQKEDLLSYAGSAGHLNIVKFIANTFTEKQIEEMVMHTFKSVVLREHIPVLDYLFSIAPNKQRDMLSENSFEICGWVDPKDKASLNVNNWLLSKCRLLFTQDLANPENYIKMKGYISIEIRYLRWQFDNFKDDFPGHDFILQDQEEIKKYFHILCNLAIQRNVDYGYYLHSKQKEDIKFLLAIPALKNLIHSILDAPASEEYFRENFSFSKATQYALKTHPEIKKLQQEQDRPSALVTYHVVASASKNKQPENIEPTPAANASKKPEGKI